MSLANIRTQIKTILDGVSGIGIVHDYDRYVNDWNKLLSLFKPTTQAKINGWVITRTATPAQWSAIARRHRVHSFLIRGFYSHDDASASEITFQALIESIYEAFEDNETLTGTCETTSPDFGPETGKAGIQVALIDL